MVIEFCKAAVQVPVWQVDAAEAGRVQALEEEVVDERIVIALVIHVVCVGDLLTSPTQQMVSPPKLPLAGRCRRGVVWEHFCQPSETQVMLSKQGLAH